MSTRFIPLATLFFSFTLTTFSQGWQSLGPDSTNWQNVRRVSGKWLSPTDYRLAAASAFYGITIYSPSTQWDYKFKSWYDPFWGTGTTYFYFDFSPWEQDFAFGFTGYAQAFVEAAFFIQRVSLTPNPLFSELPAAGCWVTPLGLLFPPESDSLVFASVCGLHRSSNRGMTWDTVAGYSWGVAFAKLLGMNKTLGHILYKSDMTPAYQAHVYLSTNRGRNWDSIFTAYVPYTQYPEESPYCAIATGDTILVGVQTTVFDTSRNIGIFRSTNGGSSWSHVYTNKRVVDIAESNVSPNTLFAASEAGIIKSTDWGATWFAYNNGLPTTQLTSLLLSPYSDTMFVSTETHGVLKVWNFLTDVAEKSPLPERFELMQNYPNPFNPTTAISYQLSALSHVTLKVYDLLGREVATLVDEVMGPGKYERTFSAPDLASGTYLLRLSTGGVIKVRKILLLK
ncbi:MAG: T9SS type A sorting domain-containing protein [Bacteroidetes bacterium]|nr:T9SS type A sorting domain-containing protein [Bacteroidota bacterium]MCW5897162.1 T9SS type A sorting domain-containing protein [Bacteroidota bacterium]